MSLLPSHVHKPVLNWVTMFELLVIDKSWERKEEKEGEEKEKEEEEEEEEEEEGLREANIMLILIPTAVLDSGKIEIAVVYYRTGSDYNDYPTEQVRRLIINVVIKK